ncbi:integrase [Nocardioides cavernae]|uniref:Integrase n=1 Tax=Nocardioides cavernae TaxID=1921566 RepID=A0A7Y9KSX5_9ACTN|nr:tyrosine-type recombinase/integrase [Nocardioides cavernae]NYE38024.1 integrase [Nocardioides cavernae]
MNARAQWPPNGGSPDRRLPRPTGEAPNGDSLAVRLREARVATFLGGDLIEPQTELDALISRTARLFAESITAQTRQDYARRWRKFEAWCVEKRIEPLNCPPEVVMMFLADHVGQHGAALGTLRSYMAAINRIHVEAGLAPPGDDPAMTMYLRSLRKAAVPADSNGQVSALTIGPLREVCRYLDSIGPDPVEIRDRALFAMHRAGAGDGEIARLRWDDVRLTSRRATLVLRSVRADRSDRTVQIRAHNDPDLCGVRAIRAWRYLSDTSVPWVVTQTSHAGGCENREWTPRDVFRIRKARLTSLGHPGVGATPEQAMRLLGSSRPGVLRDKAIILLGFAGAFRRPDLVGFRWSDVTLADSGMILRLRHSKTDRLGQGIDVGIPTGASHTTDPVAALLSWRDRVERQLGADRLENRPCFTTIGRAGRIGTEPLTPSAVSVMVRTRMAEAGIEGHWSGRSLRRGFISTAADLGLRLEDIAKGSRHATLDSLIRYIANDDPFRNNPTAQLGL